MKNMKYTQEYKNNNQYFGCILKIKGNWKGKYNASDIFWREIPFLFDHENYAFFGGSN
jgi:hypothetical protein